MSNIHVTVQPIIDSTADQWIAESDSPFTVNVIYGPGDIQEVSSLHDGLMHFVSVDVPLTARVEVAE